MNWLQRKQSIAQTTTCLREKQITKNEKYDEQVHWNITSIKVIDHRWADCIKIVVLVSPFISAQVFASYNKSERQPCCYLVGFLGFIHFLTVAVWMAAVAILVTGFSFVVSEPWFHMVMLVYVNVIFLHQWPLRRCQRQRWIVWWNVVGRYCD